MARASSARTAPPPSSGLIVAKLLPQALFSAIGLAWSRPRAFPRPILPLQTVVSPCLRIQPFSDTRSMTTSDCCEARGQVRRAISGAIPCVQELDSIELARLQIEPQR